MTLHYAKPHPLLNKKLLEGGIEWSSVIDTSGWSEHWNNHQPAPELEGDLNFLSDWLTKGFQSGMTFLEKNSEARKDLRRIFPEVKSVLSIIVPYAGGAQVRSGSGDKNKFQSDQSDNEPIPKNSLAQTTARYARVPDYHKAIKKQLNDILTDWAQEGKTLGLLTHTPNWRVVTDSLPFLDRAHARLARLGFIGKNTMLIRPGVGSYFFIAHVLLDCSFSDASDPSANRPVAADAIADLSCGDCTRCIDACPTQAIVGPRTLDSNRCLSYLTIEHRDVVRAEDIKHFAEHFYGCDVCQEVCPYNFKTSPSKTIKQFQKQNNWLKQLSALDVAQMSQAEYERWFGGTAMTRAKYAGLVRNALYSLHANQDPKLIQALEVCSKSTEPLILKTVDQLRALNKD